jgi:predicted phosphoribosyltransferase
MDRIAWIERDSTMLLGQGIFQDRRDAGRVLARTILASAAGRDCQDGIVLGLPRGGVPVAYEVALGLGLPLDILVVRKLGVPGFGELAMGAVASDGTVATNEAIIHEFRIPQEVIDETAERERREIERRERTYRNGRPPARIEGRLVILVDDGLATGASMLVGVRAVRPHARKVVVAVPVAATSTCQELRSEADEVICASVSRHFYSVGSFYRNFEQTTDNEVCALLQKARHGDPTMSGSLSEVVRQ